MSAPQTLTYRDACRLALQEALQRDDRVFLMGEDVGRYGGTYAVHALLYNQEGELSADVAGVDIRQARVRRAGRDVTIVTYGGSLWKSLEAAATLADAGIDCEVVDLRVLRPLDDATVMASVRRTHRVVVVDEGWKTGSLAAEITARIVEQAFYDLDAPIARVCSEEVPMPYAKHLEEAALPQPAKIVTAVTAMLGKG